MTTTPATIDHSVAMVEPSISGQRTRGRIVGVDAARGFAVLGMIGAHLVLVDSFDWTRPDTWFDLVNGRSAILFGVMAGISLSLVSERGRQAGGVELLRVRLSILVRALAIFVIGTLLEAIGTNFPIILGTYAVVFVAGAWLISLRPRTLIIGASATALLAPPLVLLARLLFRAEDSGTFLVETELIYVVLLSEFAPILWVAFLMVGIVVGRLDLGSTAAQVRLGLVGAGLMILGYGLGELGNQFVPLDREGGSWEMDREGGSWETLLLQFPHSATTSEAVGSTGYALVVLALCLAACSTRIGRVLLYPLAAVGALALTAYAGHFVAIALLGSYAEYSTDYTVFLQFLVVAIIFCVVWRAIFGTGPLERIVAGLARRAAQIPRTSKPRPESYLAVTPGN